MNPKIKTNINRPNKPQEALIEAALGHPEYARTESSGVAYALGRAATVMAEAETKPSGYRTPRGDRLALVAATPKYAEAIEKLNADRTGRRKMPRAQREKAIDDTYDFNQSLKDLIDNSPKVKPGELKKTVLAAYDAAYPGAAPEVRERFVRGVDETIVGMQSQLFAEQMVYAAGLDVDTDVSKPDERHGVDLWVLRPDSGERIPVDIKRGNYGAEEARKVQEEYGGKRSPIVWANVGMEYYDDGFRLSGDAVAKYTPLFIEELERELARCGLPSLMPPVEGATYREEMADYDAIRAPSGAI